MNRPRRFLLRMIAFLFIVAAVVGVLAGDLRSAFMANPPLNGLILGVLLLGIAFTFRQVIGLAPEVRWIEDFRADGAKTSSSATRRLRLLAPMARMLAARQGRVMLSAPAMRSLLDSIGSRLDESREISRYLIGLLIFLGLLGTFWGLLDTVSSVGAVIGGLSADAEDIVGTFATLKNSLAAPLGGMGTAFSSSLFGLAGSLVLGFLDLQAGQAQNQFYNDLEEWLSSVTRLSSGSGVADGDQSVPVYVQALLEKTADSLDELQRTLARGEEDRRAANTRAAELAETLAELTDRMRAEQTLIAQLAESQTDLKPALQRLADGGANGAGIDEATRGHIRNLDVYLARLVEETVNGRDYLASELRSEIKLLGRMIAAAGAAAPAPPPVAERPPAPRAPALEQRSPPPPEDTRSAPPPEAPQPPAFPAAPAPAPPAVPAPPAAPAPRAVPAPRVDAPPQAPRAPAAAPRRPAVPPRTAAPAAPPPRQERQEPRLPRAGEPGAPVPPPRPGGPPAPPDLAGRRPRPPSAPGAPPRR